MKRGLFIILFIISGHFLFAINKQIPQKPLNLPEGVELSLYGPGTWCYSYKLQDPSIFWDKNGRIFSLYYETEDKNYKIVEEYYGNGNVKCIHQKFNHGYFYNVFKDYQLSSINVFEAGKQQLFYENGNLKEERNYTPVIQENNIVNRVLCGTEILYNKTGKTIKRIEHNVKCKYGYIDIPRKSVNELIAIVKSHKDRERNQNLMNNPVVGKIDSVNSLSKEIKIVYKPGFELNIGDQICLIIENEIVSFQCRINDKGTGIFKLKEDKTGKLLLVNTSSEPFFYKKHEAKYTDVLKSGGKPKAGDVKFIAGIEFIFVPAGIFYYKEDYSIPGPGEKTEINSFWMTKYEITLGEYLKYCYEMHQRLPENKDDVTLNSRIPANLGEHYILAKNYCRWFADKYGVGTVLPQKDEWEYAARSGTTGDYYWGNDNSGDYCWYSENSNAHLHPVGEKKPNAFGLYDMIGNVWEWCEYYYLRGGSYLSMENDLKYNTIYLISYEPQREKGLIISHKDIISQGTGFRMVIRK